MFFGVWELVSVHLVVCFFECLASSTLRGHNFFNFIPFLMIFNAPYAPIRRVQILFRHQKNKAHPLDLACLECLSVIIATQFATNEQLKNLIHMFCL
jgi:hypothetical protein